MMFKIINKLSELQRNYYYDDSRKYRSKDPLKSSYVFVKRGTFGIVWINVAVFIVGHILYFFSLYLLLSRKLWLTWGFSFLMTAWSAVGIGAGAHRLWSHKSYEANLPLRLFLMLGQCVAGQNCLYIWCRDHRMHHKFSDTDADPHNIKRGYFFSHVGWLLTKKHPEMIRKAKSIDFSDLRQDPMVQFQKDYYYLLYIVFAVLIPVCIPVVLWSESWIDSFFVGYILRYVSTLHCTWFVNSTAHMFGSKPYDLNARAAENPWVSFCTFGEGFHNYHHTFPWDYATSDLGYTLNISKIFIDVFAYIGWAYNLRRPTYTMVDKQRMKSKQILFRPQYPGKSL